MEAHFRAGGRGPAPRRDLVDAPLGDPLHGLPGVRRDEAEHRVTRVAQVVGLQLCEHRAVFRSGRETGVDLLGLEPVDVHARREAAAATVGAVPSDVVRPRFAMTIDEPAETPRLDLALGWGRMSDARVLADIDITQSGRWYRWRTDDFPIPRREIETHSANMHLIPANDRVEDELDDIDAGQIVELRGYLVGVEADDGWRWISSLSREDTGASACELVYVQRARIVH